MSDSSLDMQAVEEAIERVETAVQEAAKSINHSIRENSLASLLKPFYWGVVIVVLISSVPGEVWHSKWRYALQYSVDVPRVNVQSEPHDCEFLKAPLGNKYCHFERAVSTIRWARSTDGLPISSLDEGKTWSTFTPDNGVTVPEYSTVEEVRVSWEKKEDN